MRKTLYLDLGEKTASERLGGSAYGFQPIPEGDTVDLSFRLSETADGTAREVSIGEQDREIDNAKLSLALVDKRPTDGTFSLVVEHVGSGDTEETAAIAYDASDATVQAAVEALTVLTTHGSPAVTVTARNGSWDVAIGAETGGAPTWTITGGSTNTLSPVSTIEVSERKRSGVWSSGVRLVGAPLALQTLYAVEQPAAPVVDRIQSGSTYEAVKVPEIQRLTLDPFYRSTFLLKLAPLSAQAKQSFTADSGTDTLTAVAHGYADGDLVWVEGDDLPEGLANGLNYYVRDAAADTFKLSLTAGGSAVDLSDNGSGTLEVYQWRLGTELRSGLISRTSTAADILAALEPLTNDDDNREFEVENPRAGVALISFGGDSWLGKPQQLLEQEFVEGPTGDLRLKLSTDTAGVADLLDEAAADQAAEASRDTVVEVEAVLELELTFGDAADNSVADPFTWREIVTLTRDTIKAGLTTISAPDLAAPPIRQTYTPYGENQALIGDRHFSDDFGDGAATSFNFDHNFATRNLHITVYENSTPGGQLEGGTDYTISHPTNNRLTLSGFASTPTLNQYVVLITAAGDESQWVDGLTVTTAQVTGLDFQLAAINSAIAALQAQAASGALAQRSDAAVNVSFLLPRVGQVVPARLTDGQARDLAESMGGLGDLRDVALSPLFRRARSGGVLPALHDAASESLAAILVSGELPDPAAAYAGRVFSNDSGSEVTIPGAAGRRSRKLAANGEVALHWVAADSVGWWYEVEQFGASAETTWYPADLTRTLFEFFVNDKQLILQSELLCEFSLELCSIRANVAFQAALVIEVGYPTAEASPATTGANLADIAWSATPLLEHSVRILETPSRHQLGVRIKRETLNGADTLTLDQLLYGQAVAGTAPTANNFAIRARLTRFDVEDDVLDPVGYLVLRGLADDSREVAGIATIT